MYLPSSAQTSLQKLGESIRVARKRRAWADKEGVLNLGVGTGKGIFPLTDIMSNDWEELESSEEECIACKYSGLDEAAYCSYGCPKCTCSS